MPISAVNLLQQLDFTRRNKGT